MDRFFCRRALAAALLTLLLLPAGAEERMQSRTRPVFFSMLFPQLMPDADDFRWETPAWPWLKKGAAREEVRL